MDDALEARPPLSADAVPLEGLSGDVPEALPPSSLARGGVLLAAGSATANVLGYAYTLLLSRALGPGGYGALAAVLAAGVIAGIPAVALQLVIARRTAADTARRDQTAAEGLRLSLVVGAVLVALMSVLSPIGGRFLHLQGPLPLVLLGLSLLPLTVSGGCQGILLGDERYGRLALALGLTAFGRVMAAVLALTFGWGVVGVLAATAIATTVTAAAIARLSLAKRRWLRPGTVGTNFGEYVTAGATVSGLFVLTNVDVLLARHFLASAESGAYALGALFGKATFWGSQFIPLLFFPGLAKGDQGSRRSLMLRSVALTLALGAAGMLGAAVLAGPLVRGVVGTGFSDIIGLAWLFSLLGAIWALVQLLMLSALTVPGRSRNLLLWSATAADAALVWFLLHTSIRAILLAGLVSASLLLLSMTLLERRRPSGSVPPTAHP